MYLQVLNRSHHVLSTLYLYFSSPTLYLYVMVQSNPVLTFFSSHTLYLPIRVEWLRTFLRFSKMDTMLPIRYIFMRSIPTSWLKFRRECAAKFPFLKNHRDINKEYLFNICKYLPFTSKNNRQNENEQNSFWLGKSKNLKIVEFLFILRCKKIKLDILPWHRLQKRL